MLSFYKTIYTYDEKGIIIGEELFREEKYTGLPKMSFPSVQTVKYIGLKKGVLRKIYVSDELSVSEFYDKKNLLSWTILHVEAGRKKNGKTKFKKVHYKKVYNYEYWDE